MSSPIESPTAEAIYQAIRDVPSEEIERLKAMLNEREETREEEENQWRAISARCAARFFEEETRSKNDCTT